MRKVFGLCSFLCMCALTAHAQFYVDGCDPASIKWSRIETQEYCVIYPRGLDSLARVFATRLENVRVAVGQSAGYTPNQMYTHKMPVVLHCSTADANGMVAWTPSRIELYTVPRAYDADPYPWDRHIAIHESRHDAQLQFGAAPCFKGWNIVFGQMVTGALSGLYPGQPFLEGDAVLAETALTGAGRGRSADFLEYYRCSLGKTESRDYWQWRFGSLTRYTPSYYATGYLKVAGISALCDAPGLTEHYFERITRHHGWAFGNFGKTVKEMTGLSFGTAFSNVCDSLAVIWAEEDSLRGPFMPSVAISQKPRHYRAYGRSVLVRDGLITVRSGIADNPTLVIIDSTGKEKTLRPFANQTSFIKPGRSDGKLYWSEYKMDPRWELRSFSVIVSLDSNGVRRTLTGRDRLYNPTPLEGESDIAATRYPVQGGSELVILDGGNGNIKRTFKAPDGLQVVESASCDGQLYVSAVSEGGFGIYRLPGFVQVLSPRLVKIKQLDSYDGRLTFTCNLTGVNEIYCLNPTDGALVQITDTPEGASDYAFCPDGLFFSAPTAEFKGVRFTRRDSLHLAEADWQLVHQYPIAENLSASEPVGIDWDETVDISEPKPYSKAANFFRFHSWAPLFINVDAIKSISLDNVTSAVNLGATAFWQNTLSSCYGQVGVKLIDNDFSFRPSAHAKLTYAGLYPVLEASLDFNDRPASIQRYTKGLGGISNSKSEYDGNTPYFNGSFSAYIPFNLSSGGWIRGLIPQIGTSIRNDSFVFARQKLVAPNVLQTSEYHTMPTGRVTASIRAYSILPKPQSRVYPILGIGAEAGCYVNYIPQYCPNVFGYLYGYLPGITDLQGIRLSATYQRILNNGGLFVSPYITTIPRGFSTQIQGSVAGFTNQTRLTFDYAIPFASLDWSGLCPVTYVRNLELTPFFDWSYFSSGSTSGSLFSTGASFAVVLGGLLDIEAPVHIGVRYCYKGGTLFDKVEKNTISNHNGFEMVFSVDI